MFLLLVLFLTISFAVTLAGLVLSARRRTETDQEPYYVEPYGVVPIRLRRSRSVEPLRSSRYTTAHMVGRVERGSWASTLLNTVCGVRRDGSANWPAIIVILVAVFLLSLYLLLGLLPGHPLIGYVPFPTYSSSSSSSSNQGQNAPQRTYGASAALIRLSQLDPAQYDTAEQYNTWAYSACSAAAMTEVINAYGHHYRVIDILKVESALGAITPAQGLLADIGIQRTMSQFGFNTALTYSLSLSQVIDTANHGQPVIVDFPPSKYPGGHLLVVIGGDASFVYLADSSRYDRHELTHDQFMQWWGGFAAIATPS